MKWISVEERLPEYGQNILMIFNNRDSTVRSGIFFSGPKNTFWLLIDGIAHSFDNTGTDSVTHWLPSPILDESEYDENEQG